MNNIKIETNLIGSYNDYINKCFIYLDSTKEYNKILFTKNLQNYLMKISILLN